MSDINELVALHVMNFTPADMRQRRKIEVGAFLEEHPDAKGKIRTNGAYNWPPDYCRDPIDFSGSRLNQIDRRMQALGLFDQYIAALSELIAPHGTQSEVYIALMNVTNTQRCIAALQVVGIKP